jgi:hypothetical protein
MDAPGLGTPLITMSSVKKTIKIVDRNQQRYPWRRPGTARRR